MFQKGQPVVVTMDDGRKETGRVVYQRMGAPDFNKPEAVSVKLDSVKRYGYEGTMVWASQVEVVNG